MPSRRAIRDVAAKTVALVPADALADLQDEDPALAVEFTTSRSGYAHCPASAWLEASVPSTATTRRTSIRARP